MLSRFVSALALSVVSIFAAPAISFHENSVEGSGFTPRGRVVFFSVAREPRQFWTALVPRRAVVTDSVGGGVVRFEVAGGVPRFSVWAAVDLQSGRFRVAAPDDSPFQEVAFTFNGIRSNAGNEMERFVTGQSHLQLLWVRPGEGAWIFAGGDGGSSDADRASNGRVSIRAEEMQPIGDSPRAPRHFLRR